MKVCIGNGLHPAGLEEGPLGLWTPVLRPRIGYCEYECTLCGQVCPTGAIRRLTQEEKEKTVVGLAWIDTGRCLPFAYATPCIVCEEQCPTSPKAIVLEDVTATTAGGETRTVRRPHIDPHRCVGCGICEYRCPLDGNAAIRVFATDRTEAGSVFDLG
jgi:formate hydrogenlyase subunit 6/NADH:ubiquinone oxidoreductase subunit I